MVQSRIFRRIKTCCDHFVYMSLLHFHCLNLRQDNEKRFLRASPRTRTAQEIGILYRIRWLPYRSIWVSLRSARWSGRTWCPAQRGEYAASHHGRSRRLCQPATGTPAAAPLEDWWSRTLAGQCCCTHLNITERKVNILQPGGGPAFMMSVSICQYKVLAVVMVIEVQISIWMLCYVTCSDKRCKRVIKSWWVSRVINSSTAYSESRPIQHHFKDLKQCYQVKLTLYCITYCN